ncbi:MAG: PspC domain-containing protein [Bacteroidales bacterium]|nr:PspC domain-containing protein [Bacteroidales bacterium]
MKKNININLCGVIYAIDEDACQLLEQYLDNIKNYFSKQQGGEEISDDIEHRISELFWEKKQQGVEAIDVMTVKTILKQIGNPEQMTEDNQTANHKGDESASDNADKSQSSANEEHRSNGIYGSQEEPKTKKKLFRDTSNKMIAGVLSGITKYMGWSDPLPLRICVVLIAFLTPRLMFTLNDGFIWPTRLGMFHLFSPFHIFIIAYVIAWLLIPEAKTAEDRLKMKGKPVTPETIKEEVLEEEESEKKKKRADRKE